eukprot:GHVU01010756.1.p1 GENE.GHVU01010756.1~~GHVU01010756.1.p1  ORF type:complete len:351 (+),score=35.12 GHVU01010756.1:1397-2449(+)
MNTTTVDLFSELNTRLAQEKVDEEAAIARRGALIEESKGLEVQVAALRTELDLLKVDKKACAKELDTLEAAATAAAARRARMSTIVPDPQPCRVCAVAPRVLVSRSTQTDPTADTAGALPSMPGSVVVGAPTGTSNASAVAADGNGGSEGGQRVLQPSAANSTGCPSIPFTDADNADGAEGGTVMPHPPAADMTGGLETPVAEDNGAKGTEGGEVMPNPSVADAIGGSGIPVVAEGFVEGPTRAGTDYTPQILVPRLRSQRRVDDVLHARSPVPPSSEGEGLNTHPPQNAKKTRSILLTVTPSTRKRALGAQTYEVKSILDNGYDEDGIMKFQVLWTNGGTTRQHMYSQS